VFLISNFLRDTWEKLVFNPRVFTRSSAAGLRRAPPLETLGMTRSTSQLNNMQGLLKRADLRWSYDRAFLPDKEQADIGTRELPLELAFLAAEDISPEFMEEGVGTTCRAA
jgi:hypothetical protein